MKKNYSSKSTKGLIVAGIALDCDVMSFIAEVKERKGEIKGSYTTFLQDMVREAYPAKDVKDVLAMNYQYWTGKEKERASEQVAKTKNAPTYTDLFNFVNRWQSRIRMSEQRAGSGKASGKASGKKSSDEKVKEAQKSEQQALAREARAKKKRDELAGNVKTLGQTVGAQKKDITKQKKQITISGNEINKLKKQVSRLTKELATSEADYQNLINIIKGAEKEATRDDIIKLANIS